MPNAQPSYIHGQDAVPVFDDRKSYWNATLPNVGVKVPNAGVRIAVQKQDGTSIAGSASAQRRPRTTKFA